MDCCSAVDIFRTSSSATRTIIDDLTCPAIDGATCPLMLGRDHWGPDSWTRFALLQKAIVCHLCLLTVLVLTTMPVMDAFVFPDVFPSVYKRLLSNLDFLILVLAMQVDKLSPEDQGLRIVCCVELLFVNLVKRFYCNVHTMQQEDESN